MIEQRNVSGDGRGKGYASRSAVVQTLLWIVVALAAAVLGACSSRPSKSGGYYLDDGPGANPPDNLDQIPDPVPRAEPVNRYAARPYTVLGKTYTPYTEPRPYRARGLASWYGKRYHGQKTSSGETYDMYSMSAAHTILPLPSYAKVTNLGNGRSVVVRVNDRGPFHGDRIIDLSYVAAYKLGFVNQGSAMVEVKALVPGDSSPAPAPVIAATEPPPSADPVDASATGIFVQLGAFSVSENAEAFLRKMRTDIVWLGGSMHLYRDGDLYKVHAGPYESRDAAERDVQRVRQSLGFAPLVLTR